MALPPRHRARAIDLPSRAPAERPEGVRRRVRSVSVDSGDKDPHMAAMKAINQSQQLDDPFKTHYGTIGADSSLAIVEPPFNVSSLLRLPRENNTLRQCIDAMSTNIEGHGWRLEYVGPEEGEDGTGGEESAEAVAEAITLNNLLEFPNDDHGLQDLRERVRRDLETIGNAFMEIGRDREGRVCLVAHVPAHTVRLTQKDSVPVNVAVELPREGEARIQRVNKTFRRYVQLAGTRKVFFKEIGDPRKISPATGEEDLALGLEQTATEMIHLRIYAPGTPYGIPRWINQMPAILGSRQAELTNLDFFTENAIPAMALLVSGGMVTQATMDEIEAQFMSARGRQSMNRILIIEAHGDEDAASQDGSIPAPRLDLKPMQNDRLKDALFQVYDKNNSTKVRSSFRIPPIFIGLADDYTHATAKASFQVAESQVFGPERAKGDDLWNSKILGSYKPRFWSFRSLPPRISDPTEVIEAINSFDEAGAMTPNVAIGLANDFFDLEIPLVEREWGNFPFPMTVALLAQGVIPDGFEDLVGELPELNQPEPAASGGKPGEEPEDLTEEEEAAATFRRAVLDNLLGLKRLEKVRKSRKTAPPRRRTRKSVPEE